MNSITLKVLILLEAGAGIEPTSTALQAVEQNPPKPNNDGAFGPIGGVIHF